nr:immunoglobulin light chain junction region [Macaca mulatta]MOX18048.1 immunoglobulin light chain junction region [Macaca mulatta]MOX19228.1 immunoglobulin light chain junction region [Macaca mulatta]MOX21160.1 immunoglobulin light chain junction region [Macaca mulatta]MOX22294.1 immunoglobulin light chain junction region [Macaca mulatta]
DYYCQSYDSSLSAIF